MFSVFSQLFGCFLLASFGQTTCHAPRILRALVHQLLLNTQAAQLEALPVGLFGHQLPRAPPAHGAVAECLDQGQLGASSQELGLRWARVLM